MILTDDLVYIHQPKTGGTFVTRVLEQLYPDRRVNTHKHGTCSDIPDAWRGKPIVTTIRNPYDRYVSQYRFAWWRLHPDMYCGEAAMREMFPHYPELSFGEFLGLANTLFVGHHQGQPTGFHNANFSDDRRLGWHTEQFVRFYCEKPREVFAAITEGSIVEGHWREALFPIRFLSAENLNADLHAFLRERGHAPEAIAFVRGADRIYPAEGGRAAGDRWETYYTPELKRLVRTRERLLFQLFPEYDV